MPKLAMILLAVVCAGVAVSACHYNGGTALTPTPGPTGSGSPNPKIKDALIEVTVLGTPKARIPVAESTPKSKTDPRPGTTIVTQVTLHNGRTKFTGLTPKDTYCWVATLGPGRTASTCAPWPVWQYTMPIVIGT
jgi:hypothetical protein